MSNKLPSYRGMKLTIDDNEPLQHICAGHLVPMTLDPETNWVCCGLCMRDKAGRLERERDRWKTVAFCRSCEPLDNYYCTNHREEEEE